MDGWRVLSIFRLFMTFEASLCREQKTVSNGSARQCLDELIKVFCVPQICWTYDKLWSSGPGVSGAAGLIHGSAHHQHREERCGVHAAPRPQTSPRSGLESDSLRNHEVEREDFIILLFSYFRTTLLIFF